jgi:O-antigen ligase
LVFIFFSVLSFNNSSLEESYFQRVELNEVAIRLFLQSPVIGVGLNNFIPTMATQKDFGQLYWLQPVHNIFLLLIAEAGLTGLTLFLILIIKLFRFLSATKNFRFLMILGVIILTGLFDHYWLMLQQNLLLFGIIIGVSFPPQKKTLKTF